MTSLCRKQLFHHVYDNGQRHSLYVEQMDGIVRYRFLWFPAFHSREDLMEIHDEFVAWRDYWTAGELGPNHSVHDFQFHQSCEIEWRALEELFP